MPLTRPVVANLESSSRWASSSRSGAAPVPASEESGCDEEADDGERLRIGAGIGTIELLSDLADLLREPLFLKSSERREEGGEGGLVEKDLGRGVRGAALREELDRTVEVGFGLRDPLREGG